jgi:hypothetical protein
MKRTMTLSLSLVVAALCSACGSSDDRSLDTQAQTGPPVRELTVSEAIALRPSRVVRIRGGLLVRRNEAVRLCSSLSSRQPPRCGGPALIVKGLGSPYRAIEGLESLHDGRSIEPRAGWGRRVVLSGRLEGRSTLRLVTPEQSRRVITHFRKETGHDLVHDLFLSNEDLDHVNFESSRNPRAVRAARTKWGLFDIIVPLSRRADPIQAVRAELDPYVLEVSGGLDRDGIQWLRLRRYGWVALSAYEPGVVLQWRAGKTKAIDARWKLLDAVLQRLG